MGCDAGANIILDQISGKYTCVPCVVGTYKTNFGTGSCTNCAEGKFRDETGGIAESECLSCTALQFSSAGADECRNCPLNAQTWSNGATCTCNDGYVGYGTDVVCEPCALGFFKNCGGADSCLQCLNPFSTTLNLATTDKYDCVCGKGYAGWDAKTVCDGDTCTTTEITNNQCTACVPGKYKDYAGAGSCQDCAIGSTSLGPASATAAACICQAGFTGADPTACTPCSSGTYKSTPGSQACTSCVENTHSETQSTRHSDCRCVAGWFEDTDPVPVFALSVDNFDTLLIEIARLSPVVVTWPGSSHPDGITDNKETLEEVAGLTVNYNEPDGSTMFTLASSFDGPQA